MRTLEIVLWAVTSAWLVWRVWGNRRWEIDAGFTGTIIVLAAFHTTLDGVRVHMIPTYASAAVLIALGSTTWRERRGRSRRWVRVASSLAAAAWIAIAAILPSMFPVYDAQLARWGLDAAGFRTAEQDHYARQMQLIGRAAAPIYNVYIRRTNHVTFSDLNLIIRLPDSELMDIRRAHRIINDYTIAFFDRYLNGASVSLVDGRTPSPYEEVTVASRNVEAAEQSVRHAR